MLSLKTPLAIIIAVICAAVAYFVSASSAQSSVAIYLPSIFSIVSVVVLIIVSSIINSNTQTLSNSSSKTEVAESSTTGLSTLYIGNLAYKANEAIVQEHFAKIGDVKSVRLVKDKKTGRRKGFGFVEINAKDESKFIKALNESDFMERSIIVRPANDKKH